MLFRSEITFLYKLVAGASDRSFGLNVAMLAQVSHMQCFMSFFSFFEFWRTLLLSWALLISVVLLVSE